MQDYISTLESLKNKYKPPVSSSDKPDEAYADGVIVCASTNIYFTQDGITYLQLNRASVSGSGDNFSTFSGRSNDARTSQGQCSFALFEGTSDYGEVLICDGANKPFFFKMTGTGGLSDRTFFAGEITTNI